SGVLTPYHGDYQYYLDKSATIVPVVPVATPAPVAKPTIREQKRRSSEDRQATSRERHEAQQLVTKLEAEIAKLEKSQLELTAELELPATYEKPGHAVEVNRKLTGIAEALARITPEWEAAAARLSATPAKSE
ncbi:MAG: ABC transporter C-terminal domain-containing protein, partial [Verrucomicrobiota bacterium]